MLRRIFNWTALSSMIAVFTVIWLIKTLAINLDFLNIIEEVFQDFKVTDLYFSHIRDNDAIEKDDRIVIVNIGEGSNVRGDIAMQVALINEGQPRAIGIDVLLAAPKEEMTDNILAESFAQTKNLILATKLLLDSIKQSNDSLIWQSALCPIPAFAKSGYLAYVNLVTEDDTKVFETSRLIARQEYVLDSLMLSFPAALAASYDSAAVKTFLDRQLHRDPFPFNLLPLASRQNQLEMIRYTRNTDKYTVLDPEYFYSDDFDPSIFKDKIVLLGFMGHTYKELTGEDRYYTPMNERPIGRTEADMYGVVIHANVISMILDNDYIAPSPNGFSWIMAIIFGYFNAALFCNWYFSPRLGSWYDFISKSFQVVEVLVLAAIGLWALAVYGVVLDFSIAMVVILFSSDVLEIYLALLSRWVKSASKPFYS
ncbi:MAG: CHASE2 domain-containing protein [Bernardetiaceae bacterium]|nr:CHASE2 domain-containing protein [Bernardetiaceae bacterium]